MRIDRIGFTPLKGTRHASHSSATLAEGGPEGDRVFCLVDPARERVLRTVENPTLMQTEARWRLGVLSVDLPGVSVEGVPTPTGEVVKVDYWGRVAALEVQAGPWAAAYSELLGYDVVLTRAVNPGEVVYGAPVSLVTTSSLAALAGRLGHGDSGPANRDEAARRLARRFRATVTVGTDEADAHVEDSWVGRELQLGSARVLVRGPIPRCAVIDHDPVTGSRDEPLMRALAGYRREGTEVSFGVDAVVVEPGTVAVGDQICLERG